MASYDPLTMVQEQRPYNVPEELYNLTQLADVSIAAGKLSTASQRGSPFEPDYLSQSTAKLYSPIKHGTPLRHHDASPKMTTTVTAATIDFSTHVPYSYHTLKRAETDQPNILEEVQDKGYVTKQHLLPACEPLDLHTLSSPEDALMAAAVPAKKKWTKKWEIIHGPVSPAGPIVQLQHPVEEPVYIVRPVVQVEQQQQQHQPHHQQIATHVSPLILSAAATVDSERSGLIYYAPTIRRVENITLAPVEVVDAKETYRKDGDDKEIQLYTIIGCPELGQEASVSRYGNGQQVAFCGSSSSEESQDAASPTEGYSHKVFDRKKTRKARTVSCRSGSSSSVCATQSDGASQDAMLVQVEESSEAEQRSSSELEGSSRDAKDDSELGGDDRAMKSGEETGNSRPEDVHVCPECNKRYSTSSNLARHRQTHREERSNNGITDGQGQGQQPSNTRYNYPTNVPFKDVLRAKIREVVEDNCKRTARLLAAANGTTTPTPPSGTVPREPTLQSNRISVIRIAGSPGGYATGSGGPEYPQESYALFRWQADQFPTGHRSAMASSTAQTTLSVDKCPSRYEANDVPYALSEVHRTIALQELGETDERRVESLRALREWIATHPHIRACRTDALFLLRFLRARAYDLQAAQTTLVRYLTMRQLFRLWYENLDPTDRYMRELVETVRGCLPLGLDRSGRMVALVKVRSYDVTRFNCYHLGRLQHMLFEAFFDDVEVQIAGGVAIIDCEGATMGHFVCFKLSDIRNFMDCLVHALPVRVKEVHIVRLPRIGQALGNLVLSFAAEDLRKRIFFHASMEEVLKYVDRDLLPVEYGGKTCPEEITDSLQRRLANKRDTLLLLDRMEIELEPYAHLWRQHERIKRFVYRVEAVTHHGKENVRVEFSVHLESKAAATERSPRPKERMSSPASSSNYSVEKRPPVYDQYEFTLPDLYRKIAKEELREDDEIREQSLTQMREWIAKHPYIRKCRTDSSFLLRFLRFRKYSVPMACEALERYLAMRQTFPTWFKNLDCNDPVMREILQDGVFSKLGQDSEGRMVVLFRAKLMNVEKFGPLEQGRLVALLIESLLEWEELQIGGFRVMVDFTDTVMKLYGMWGISDMKIFMDAVNRSYPIRFREINGAKFPKFALSILNLLLSFASPKLKERIVCHSTVLEMKRKFEPPLLPQQYGGELDTDEMVRKLIKHLEDRRNVILALDDMDIDVAHYSSLWNQSNVVENEVEGGVAGTTMETKHFSVEKCPESYDQYEFTLSDLYRKIAKEELREDDEIREQSLTQMREWIAKHPYIRKCRTDSSFLLRFLRFRKYSVPMACETLVRYLAMRQTFPQWFKNLDCNDPAMREMLEDGVFTKLGQDADGRTVILFRFARFNVDKFSALQEGRFTVLLIETLLEWEELQIGGFRVLIDYTDSVLKHYGIWGVSDMKVFMDAINRSFPIRIREIHGAKFPKFAVSLLNLLLSFASPKLKDRITCHNNLEEMTKRCDPALLPKEWGGSCDLQVLKEQFQAHLDERREVLLALDEMDIDTSNYSTLWQHNTAPENEIDSGAMGSFRKLDVD
uniref:CRAL-TRIO domain-containing protein n=2 Tax=Anopheles epiroticus TaxID=199890 RepID=A0A182PJU6_9DIPT